MGGSTSPARMALRSLLWSLFVLTAVAHDYRRAGFYVRATSSASASSPPSTIGSVSTSATSSSTSASFSPSSSSSTSTSTSSPLSRSSSTTTSSTTTSSSSTSVTTTITTSSQPASSSSVSTSASVLSTSTTSTSTSKTSAKLAATPPKTSSPASTLDVSPDIATTSDDQPTSTPSAKTNVAAASTGFWGNKGAVGGTFTVVALVVVGILVAVGIVLRRRAASHNSARDTFFDTKNPVERMEHRHSPGPSMVSLGNEPMDAHATPNPNYGDQYLVDTGDYNVGYPPGASYPPAADTEAQQYYTTADQHYPSTADQHYPSATAAQDPYYVQDNTYDNYNQFYAAADAGGNGYSVTPANHRPSLSPHPYSHPSHANGAPPSAMRDLAGRDSYQPSIDSFYGAAGTAS